MIMNEDTNDDYYVCVNCGVLIMATELLGKKDKCPICGSEDLDFFEG